MRKSRFVTKILATVLCIAMLIPLAVTTNAAETGSDSAAFTSISTTRLSMTDQREVTLSFNLGYKPEATNLEWTFGGDPLDEWRNWEDEENGGEPVFTVKDLTIAENGDVSAVLSVDYLFDGDDAAYWRPWYAYRGLYELKVTDKSTGKSASQTMRYEVYDSYTPYDELDSKIKDIMDHQTNNLYMSYESTGLSTDGKDIMEVIVARDKAVVDNYMALLQRAQTDPEAVAADVKSGKLADYQIPVYITNIHPNECPAVDQQIEFLKAIATEETISYKNADNETCTYNVKDVLSDVFFIIRPTENPYALEHYQRGNSEDFDLNRDSTYQTQIESQVATADLVKWKPVTLVELHGFIYYARTQLQIEPCTPPHEPNLEYDLFMNYALQGARAFGDVASMNSIYNSSSEYAKENGSTEDNKPWYDIALESGFDPATGRFEYPSDDMSTNYTPTYALFHGTIGYTVECGENNEASVTMGKYGLIGHTAYVAENKDDLYLNQLEFFRRALNNEESPETEKWFVTQDNQVEANFREKDEYGKFYPEYYVIPTDADSQRDIADAYFMQEYFIRNGVQVEKLTEDVTVDGVTYKAGAFVIDMHQISRSFANAVLYKGKIVKNWTGLYSESVTNFPELRGFDCTAITKAGVFEGKTADANTVEYGTAWVTTYGNTATVISNNGLAAVNAVNDLLAKGVTVGFITEAGDHYSKGDFVIDHKDAGQIDDQYVIEITHVADVPKAKVITEPKVYVDDDHFDRFAFSRQMNFKTTSDVSEANVVFSSNEPEEDVQAAVKAGLPFVGASANILEYAKATIPGFDFDIQWIIEEGMYGPEEVYNDYEALFNVEYADSLITASYAADGDFTTYTKGGSIISAYPEEAAVLMRASSEDNFYKAGWWNGIDDPEAGLKGHAVAIDYQANGLDMTVFCTSITNKAHQTDDYRLATNAIYSKLLGADFTVESGETPEPTPNPDTKPDTGKDTQSPETGDGMTVTVWVMAATLSVTAVLVLSAKKREDRSSSAT
mgnify:FL=1